MIRLITAAQTRPLRQVVLRPQQTAEELVYPGDDEPRTVHFGAFVDDRLVGIASIYVEAMPGEINPGAGPSVRVDSGPIEGPDITPPSPDTDWRLRGMATLPEVRGTGLGGALLESCIDHVRVNGGTRFWCHARGTAAGFYLRYSFVVEGEEYELPGIGPHYMMSRTIEPHLP